jgi:site-specific DNA-methyltransferase (adenine-specific)
MINITNEDNMQLMARHEDNHFDLAIVDPEYGIGINKQSQGKGGGVAKKIEYKKKDWDSKIPPKEYFKELMRVSKNQIIWGGNYFIDYLKATPCFIVWDKVNGDTDFADCELAWTSFKTSTRKIKWKWAGMLQHDMKNKEVRIHPTQKPVKLYEWLLLNYAKKGDKILDTHGGSLSIALAVHNVNTQNKMNLTLDVCELDKDYYLAGKERLRKHQQQLTIF